MLLKKDNFDDKYSFVEYIKYSTPFIAVFMFLIFSIGKYYIDDNARAVDGYFGWESEGRPLSSLIVYMLNGGNFLTDIAPLSQILAISVAIITCAIIGSCVIKKDPLSSAIASCMLFTSPYYIENLSFRFDSLSMNISILLCCIPFIFIRSSNRYLFIASSFFFTMLSLLTYQAALPVFYACIIVFIVSDRNREALHTKNIFYSLIASAISLFIYVFFISNFFVSTGYAKTNSQILSPFDVDFKYLIIRNIVLAARPIHDLIDSSFLTYYTLPLLTFAAICIFSLRITKSRFPILSLASLAFACSVIMFYITKTPSINARMMIWFNSGLFIIFSVLTSKINKKLFLTISIAPILFNFSFANDYHVSQIKQLQFEREILSSVYVQYLTHNFTGPILFVGKSPLSPITKAIVEKRKLIGGVMRQDIGTWTTPKFARLNMPFLTIHYVKSKNYKCSDLKIPFNGIYSIYTVNDENIVTFKNECSI